MSKKSSGQQPQNGLVGLIRLSKHRRAGLLQDVQASQVGALRSDINIRDTAVCGLEVGLVHREHIGGEGETNLLRTV